MILFDQDNVREFFSDLLEDLDCHEDTKSYIVSIYSKYKTAEHDYSQDSITLKFSEARAKHNFNIYQNLGDWIFFTQTVMPGHLRFASKEYYDSIAQLSYYSCFRLINKKWRLFEELADQYVNIEKQVKIQLQDNHLFKL